MEFCFPLWSLGPFKGWPFNASLSWVNSTSHTGTGIMQFVSIFAIWTTCNQRGVRKLLRTPSRNWPGDASLLSGRNELLVKWLSMVEHSRWISEGAFRSAETFMTIRTPKRAGAQARNMLVHKKWNVGVSTLLAELYLLTSLLISCLPPSPCWIKCLMHTPVYWPAPEKNTVPYNVQWV